MMYLKTILSLLLSIIAVTTPACSSSQVRVGFIGSQLGNGMAYEYALFSGQALKTLRLDQGQKLDLRYDLRVESGSLTLQLIDQQGNVSWEEFYVDDVSDIVNLEIEGDGFYKISVVGQKAEGGFDIEWELQ